MIALETEDGTVFVNPLLVCAVLPYMRQKDKCKVCFSEEKGNFLVIQSPAHEVSEAVSESLRYLLRQTKA
jgi:hypothetical protein